MNLLSATSVIAAWRAAIGIDDIMVDPAWIEAERGYKLLLLYDYLGCDCCGRPVMVERCGAWNVDEVCASADTASKQHSKLRPKS